MRKGFYNVPAPAKLNLFLHVTGRRDDGYHELESLFCLIDLMDSLDFERLESGEITRSGDVIGDVDKDLCVRAARALQQATGCTLGAHITVRKRIPSGAGLGGGSSDAATTLIALNRLWDLHLSRQALIDIGVTLGADVPFFLFGQTAFAKGIGEKLTAMALPPARWIVAMPQVPTATASIFSSPLLTRDTKSITMALLSELIHSRWPELPGRNDLQPVVQSQNQAVREALEALGPQSRMTGSGSAVFTYATSSVKIDEITQKLSQETTVYAVNTVDKHPLFTWVP